MSKQLRLLRFEAVLRAIELLREAHARLSPRIELRIERLHLKLQFMNEIFTIARRALAITNIPPRTRKFVLKAVNIAFQSVDFQLQRELRSRMRLPELLRPLLHLPKRILDGFEVALAVGK